MDRFININPTSLQCLETNAVNAEKIAPDLLKTHKTEM